MNYHSCGMRMWAEVYFVLSQRTRLTEGQTDSRSTDREKDLRSIPCMGCNSRTVKMDVINMNIRPLAISNSLKHVVLLLLSFRRNCYMYFRDSDQNSDIAMKFSNPGSQNKAILWRPQHIFSCFSLYRSNIGYSTSALYNLMNLNKCHMLRSVLG